MTPIPSPILLFDAYGTLVELDDFYRRLQRGFARNDVDVPLEVVTRAAHREMKHYIKNSLRAHQNDEWHALRSECAAILASSIREQNPDFDLPDDLVLQILSDAIVFRAFPETRAVLESLRNRGCKMGVMSNWDYQLSDVLRSLHLNEFFDFILSSAQIGHEKPSPQFFERALQEAERLQEAPRMSTSASTHVASSQVFYIGDHYEKDVMPSKRAGITPLWLVRDQRDLVSGEIGEASGVRKIATLNEVVSVVAEVTNVDCLTGLFNWQYTMEELRRIISEIKPLYLPNPGTVGAIFANMFQMKRPHDNYGHPPIDGAIRDVGRVVQSLARENDIACRYGGNQFLLIMPGVTKEETRQKAEQLRRSAGQLHIMVNGQPKEPIVLSIGFAHYPSIYDEAGSSKLRGAEALMQAADAELARDRERNVQMQAG